MFSVWIRTSLPGRRPLSRLRARSTASNSRQLVLQHSWGPVHTPDTGCMLYMTPKPVAVASVSNTVCLDTCSRGTHARRICPRAEGSAAGRCHLNPVSTALSRPLSLRLQPHAPGSSERVSVGPPACLIKFFSIIMYDYSTHKRSVSISFK